MPALRPCFRILLHPVFHAILAGLMSLQAFGEIRYSVTNLGTLGGVGALASAINDSGEVVGQAVISWADSMVPFIWLPKPKYGLPAGISEIAHPSNTRRGARDINNAGHVVGGGDDGMDVNEAFLWIAGTTFPIHPTRWTAAQTINENGTMGGIGSRRITGTYEYDAVEAWRGTAGNISFLGTLNQDTIFSFAYGINERNHLVGRSYGNGVNRAVRWIGANPLHLGTPPNMEEAEALAINDSGAIVGQSWRDGAYLRGWATLWEADTIVQLWNNGIASSVNNHREVVGSEYVNNRNWAVYWNDGVMYHLDTLIDTTSGWRLLRAIDINDKGQIVGEGLFNGALRPFLLTPLNLKIIRPTEGMKWIAGTTDTIRWNGGQQGRFVNLFLSVDSGSTYSGIRSNHPSDSAYYAWTIPEDTLSKKCLIRIVDVLDNRNADTSAVFKIKGYILTRDSSGQYEPYRFNEDRWGFANTPADIWPPAWYNQFNYNGTDPFTGLNYLSGGPIAASVFSSAAPSDHPDWPSFVRTFTVNACYLSTTTPVYRAAAVTRWAALKENWGGSCFGFAISNAIVFRNKGDFRSRYSGFPNFNKPIDVGSSNATIPVINELYIHQFGQPHVNYSNAALNKTPNQTLDELKAMLLSEDDPVQSLSFLHNGGSGGHAVLAYKVTKDAQQASRYNVYVYDNSNGGVENARIVIDTAANNNNGDWSFALWQGWGGGKWLYLEDPAVSYLTNPTLTRIDPPRRGSVFAPPDSVIQLHGNRATSISVHDSLGRVTGYVGGQIQAEIPASYPLIIKNGSVGPPYGYSVPVGQYSVTLNNFTTSQSRMFLFVGNRILGVDRTDASSGQTDRLGIDGSSIAVSNPDSSTKTFRLQSILDESSQEKIAVFTSLALAQGDSMQFALPDGERIRLSSYAAGPRTYALELHFATENGVGVFGNSNVVIAANSSHWLVPNWQNLSGGPLQIQVDLGNNGTIDDTIYVNNTLSVDDQGSLLLPREYNLAQNYPNPFNPYTTIRYALPHESRVKLTVYDILGRSVTTLVDEEQAVGYHAVRWEGTNASGVMVGSGVYFYKLESRALHGNRSFVSVKKMLMVK